MFENAKRILLFTDMSTECDDECALLWLLSALNNRKFVTTLELVMVDSHVRFQWMAHLFKDKLETGGEWEVRANGHSFQFGYCLVNLYLAPDPQKEPGVIKDIQKKAPWADINVHDVADGDSSRKSATRKNGELGGRPVSEIPPGPLDSITVAGPVPDCCINLEFFKRFEDIKNLYVVGTPGGVNCPLPAWPKILAPLHMLGPVLYLTPQFTRGVRFPKAYVLSNTYWNDHIKRTVWDATLTCMARRPEIPAMFGNWGLVLRLNVANAIFCKDWYSDVMQSEMDDKIPERLVQIVSTYVERNSGDDRKPGALLQELKSIGVELTGPGCDEIDAKGQPTTPAGKEALRAEYRKQLFTSTMVCVRCTDTLLCQNSANFEPVKGKGNFSVMEPRCGYTNPHKSLADLFGAENGIEMLRDLPLKRLTPAYDVVAMMCVVSGLEGKGCYDIGLDVKEADDSMGLATLSEEERALSDFPILMVPQQLDLVLDDQIRRLSRVS